MHQWILKAVINLGCNINSVEVLFLLSSHCFKSLRSQSPLTVLCLPSSQDGVCCSDMNAEPLPEIITVHQIPVKRMWITLELLWCCSNLFRTNRNLSYVYCCHPLTPPSLWTRAAFLFMCQKWARQTRRQIYSTVSHTGPLLISSAMKRNEKNDTGHRNFPGSSPHSFPPTYPLKSHFVLSIEFPCKNESSGPTQCRPETVGTSLRLFPPHHLKITCWKWRLLTYLSLFFLSSSCLLHLSFSSCGTDSTEAACFSVPVP